MKIGIAADHGGFELKVILLEFLKERGFEVEDFGAFTLNDQDDYPDFVIPLARAVAAGTDRWCWLLGSAAFRAVPAHLAPRPPC